MEVVLETDSVIARLLTADQYPRHFGQSHIYTPAPTLEEKKPPAETTFRIK